MNNLDIVSKLVLVFGIELLLKHCGEEGGSIRHIGTLDTINSHFKILETEGYAAYYFWDDEEYFLFPTQKADALIKGVLNINLQQMWIAR